MNIKTLATIALATACAALQPSPANASSHKARTIQETVSDSDLILVGTVTAIDDAVGVKDGDPMTRIDVLVDRALRGGPLKRGETFSFFHRGGDRGDDTAVLWSGVEPFTVGDTYVLFLASSFTITPLIERPWRIVQAGAGKVVVNSSGRTIGVSPTHGIMRGSVVASTLLDRAVQRNEDLMLESSRSSSTRADASGAEDIGSMSTPMADAETVLAGVAEIARSSMPTVSEMKSGAMPLPLNARTTEVGK